MSVARDKRIKFLAEATAWVVLLGLAVLFGLGVYSVGSWVF